AVRQLFGRLAADVRAEEVEDRAAPGEAEKGELERLRDEREAKVEVEDVRAREQPGERAPLGQLAAAEPAGAVERPVRLGVQAAPLEDDEASVDPLPPQRLHVGPRDTRDVDRTMRNAQGERVGRSAAA